MQHRPLDALNAGALLDGECAQILEQPARLTGPEAGVAPTLLHPNGRSLDGGCSDRVSTFSVMSQGRFRDSPLAPEDDWFYEPDVPPSAGREEPREPDTSHEEPRRTRRPTGERDRRIFVAVIVGALVLLVAGILGARALTGSSNDGGETITTTLPTSTTPSTTPTPTTPATPATPTTPTTTTPTTTTPTTTTPTTTTPTTLPEGVTLLRGDKSGDVSHVQAALVELGYSTGGVDGKFGKATEQAVRDFQKSSGLAEDGVVGPATLSALSAAVNQS